MMAAPFLSVENLTVRYRADAGRAIRAVDHVSFEVERGETFGLVGESGCGKSTISFGIMGLLPRGTFVGGSVRLAGDDLLRMSPGQLAKVRGPRMAMVFQAAMNALNPVIPVGQQIIEPMLHHGTVPDPAAAWQRAAELFGLVGLPASRLAAYPHEMSGGMRQRAVLAMSLACGPQLLIADEPTTALDVIVQDQIFLRLQDLKSRLGLTLVLVSHDIGLIAETCDRVGVMYGGRLVECGPARDVLERSRHPYSRALSQATPRLHGGDLVVLPGTPPDLAEPHPDCIFAHRCPLVAEPCHQRQPSPIVVRDDWTAACLFADRDISQATDAGLTHLPPVRDCMPKAAPPRIAADHLRKTFAIRQKGLAALMAKPLRLQAVDDVTLDLAPGEAVALVGESGSGKTTFGAMLAGLETPTGGLIRQDGDRPSPSTHDGRLAFHRAVQVIFQDPYDSLDPRMTIGDSVEEPLIVHRQGNAADRRRKVVEVLHRVGLTPAEEIAARLPRNLSGGQRQRVAIARAMVLEPKVLVADEPLSMLDASVKAGILGLLGSFKAEGVSILLITHDLSVTRHLCDRIAVMYLGLLVEVGPTRTLIEAPAHPYTQMLMAAVPDLDRRLDPSRLVDESEPPNPADKPSGCAFHPRCPRATDICRSDAPTLVVHDDHPVACWHPGPAAQITEPQRRSIVP